MDNREIWDRQASLHTTFHRLNSTLTPNPGHDGRMHGRTKPSRTSRKGCDHNSFCNDRVAAACEPERSERVVSTHYSDAHGECELDAHRTSTASAPQLSCAQQRACWQRDVTLTDAPTRHCRSRVTQERAASPAHAGTPAAASPCRPEDDLSTETSRRAGRGEDAMRRWR